MAVAVLVILPLPVMLDKRAPQKIIEPFVGRGVAWWTLSSGLLLTPVRQGADQGGTVSPGGRNRPAPLPQLGS